MDGDRIIELVLKRRAYLEQLALGPKSPRDLVDALGDSRATVHRALGDLSGTELVAERNGQYETTRAGALLLETVADALETTRTVRGGADLLDRLPADAPLDPVFFRHAEPVPVEPPSLEANIQRAIDHLEAAERVSVMAVADNSAEWVETLYDRSVYDESLACDVVLTEAVADYSIDEYTDRIRDATRSEYADVRVRDTLPYGLVVFEYEVGATAFLLVHGDQSEYLGHFEAEARPANLWAKAVFRDHFESARPLEAYEPCLARE